MVEIKILSCTEAYLAATFEAWQRDGWTLAGDIVVRYDVGRGINFIYAPMKREVGPGKTVKQTGHSEGGGAYYNEGI